MLVVQDPARWTFPETLATNPGTGWYSSVWASARLYRQAMEGLQSLRVKVSQRYDEMPAVLRKSLLPKEKAH